MVTLYYIEQFNVFGDSDMPEISSLEGGKVYIDWVQENECATSKHPEASLS